MLRSELQSGAWRLEPGARRLGLATLGLLLIGCEIEKVSIPQTEKQLAMHGMLSASAGQQVVLLERTRNGSVGIVGAPFDLPDPVVTDEGIAETGATVTLTTPSGLIIAAREANTVRSDRKGHGNYWIALPGDLLERGGAYRLHIQTARGEVITAETTVPSGTPATVAEQRTFNRSGDAEVIEWDAAPDARSYMVRVETPYGPLTFFTDSTRVRLTGELRNVDARGMPRVFIPGFPQAVTVSAVDSNYYDWFRTHNNRLTGTGVVSRITGGIGVFGSMVRLRFLDYRVVTPQTQPMTGTFRVIGPPEEVSTTLLLGLELYVESPSARSDQADALSGRYERRPTFGYSGELINGLLGTSRNGRLELALLRGWTATDTVDVFTGEVRGDTIVGSYRFAGGPVRFLRQ